ncbi:MAG: hypothetical protein H7A55_09230 [Verrucomicrobiaceae bacterium]|nr:hypothetical protein [Verrucomicrobiaceae bacterium]
MKPRLPLTYFYPELMNLTYHIRICSQSIGQTRPNKTDAGNGSKAICRVSNVLRSPSPDPRRQPKI